jgi:hypothetical protein
MAIFQDQSSDLGDSCHQEEDEVYDGEFMNSDDDYDDDDDVDADNIHNADHSYQHHSEQSGKEGFQHISA